jgi:dTDP-4-dehydrorhamnose reductase
MRILVTGAGGMLGTDVRAAAAAAGVEAIAHDHPSLDIADSSAVDAAIGQAKPDAIVNCAASTDVDGAESASEVALASNRDGPANLALAASANGAWLIHISSDYVFDGTKAEPYVESDPVAPISAYGRAKFEGELAVARAAPGAHTIVRTAWLFGAAGKCFPKTIMRLAAERDELTVVDDQVGCPTFTGHLAPALVELAVGERMEGVVHVAAAGACSWFEFATEIVRAAKLSCEVRPGRSDDVDRPAPRPAYSVLRSERAGAPQLLDWHMGLEEFMTAGVALA